MKTTIHFWIYLAQFFLEWEMLQEKVVEKVRTYVSCSVTFFFENRAVYEIMRNNIVGPGRPQMTIWRMHIAWWMPTNKSTNTHTHTICNSYCFYTATVFARKRLNVPVYVRCLSCFSCRVYGWDLNNRSSDGTPPDLTKRKIKCMVILCKILPRVTHHLSAWGCSQFLVPTCKIKKNLQWVGFDHRISSKIWRHVMPQGTEMMLDKP
jgi:hypothetical protein